MSVKIYTGDALSVLRTLESESVQCVVTSPPYFQLRDYKCDGQIGMEQTPAEFIAKLIAVFEEVKRVCRNDATLWVNIGDSYSGSGKGTPGPNALIKHTERQGFVGAGADARNGTATVHQTGQTFGIPAKNLLLIPERFAIAMQDAGWYVRSRIAWCKTSAMPESVRDRPTSAWEHLWLFTKARTYYYDAEAVRQPAKYGRREWKGDGYGYVREADPNDKRINQKGTIGGAGDDPSAGANLRNYWLLGPEPSSLEHYASFVTEIPRRCILAGTSQRGCCPACRAPWVRVVERGELVTTDHKRHAVGKYAAERSPFVASHRSYHDGSGGTIPNAYRPTTVTGWSPGCACDAGEPVPCVVLDPFLGSGMTALVASRLGRDAVGIELSPTYTEMARQRIYGDAPLFADIEVAG